MKDIREGFFKLSFISFLLIVSLFFAKGVISPYDENILFFPDDNSANDLINKKEEFNKEITGYAIHPVHSGFSEPEQRFSFNNISRMVSVSDTIIYKIGYYSVEGGAWQSFNFSGEEYNGNSNWIKGFASNYLPLFGEGEHYVISYSCTYKESWNCHENLWQLLVLTENAGQVRYLVDNNVELADIVVSPDAPGSVLLAADYFQMYIYNMTGATLPINNNPSEEYDFHVYIGQSNYTDAMGINSSGCEYSGFKIASGEDYLVLLGQDNLIEIAGYRIPGPQNTAEWDALTGEDRWTNDFVDYYGNSYNDQYNMWEEDKRGSLNAVFEFLYSQGIRWYHPGWYEYPGLGTIIPEKEDVSFTDINTVINPDFQMREFYMYSMGFGPSDYQYDGMYEEMMQWQLSLRGNSYFEFLIGSLGGPGHGIRAVIAREETESSHPEYYATIDGELMNESNPVPNLCSEELLEANIRYVKAMFDVYNVSMVSVMPTDGFTSASDDCAWMEQEGTYDNSGALSNYVWEYVNNVAWAIYEDGNYSDKRIFAGAYTTYQLPPTNLSRELAPNIAVVITKWRTWIADEETEEHFQNLVDEWYNILPSHEVYTYDYYLHNLVDSQTQTIPMFFPHLTSEDLKFLNGKSRGEMIEISSTSEWPPYEFTTQEWNLEWDAFAANSFNTYVTARLYWNSSLDIDELLEEYYTLFYGLAREEMKAFYEYSEAHLDDIMVNPEVTYTMRQMISNARDVAGETEYGHRIDLLIGLMNSTGPEERFIDSCQTLYAPSTTYKLTSDVTSPDTCFTIYNVGVVLDCQGHTITFGTGGEGNFYGVYVPYTSGLYASTIKNCKINFNGADVGYRAGIHLATTEGYTVYNNTINVTGTGIWIIDSSDVNITGNRVFSSTSDPFSTQVLYNGIVSNNNFSSSSGSGTYLYDTYNVTLDRNNISSVSGYGLQITLGGNNIFTNNILASVSGSGLNEYDSSGNVFVNNTISP